MKLVEQHIVNSNHPYWKECDRICFLSKNLYNQALYRIKQQYEKDKSYLSYFILYKQMADENQIDYRALPQNCSQQILRQLDTNIKAYFKALKEFKINPSKFSGLPQLPNFKHKTKGRNICIYPTHVIRKKQLKEGIIQLTGTELYIKTKQKNINQVTIIPMNNKSYKICIIYEKEEKQKIKNDRYCGIDIGLNNLATVGFNKNGIQPIIINGRPLKSINQYYNKKLAKLKSKLPKYYVNNNKLKNKEINNLNEENKIIIKQKSKSKRIEKLTNKRNNKINDYLHKASKIMVEKLQQNNIGTVVIGKNDNWKKEINIGKRNNQNFVTIPHARFIEMLTYKCELEGITLILREESYTSKSSFLDNELPRKRDSYVGKRICRGLFKSSTSKIYNADLNGALNILRKEFPKVFTDGIEGLVINPIVLTIK